MKKEAIVILFLLSISFCLAEPVFNIKSDYSTGETAIATITAPGNFTKAIQKSDIQFFEGKRQAFFDYDIILYNNTHYFYVSLQRQGNFTIKINNILYNPGTLQSSNIEKNISVKDSNNSISIMPGFINSLNPEITIFNKAKNQTISYTYNNVSETLTLQQLQIKKIQFTPNQEFSYFTIKSYQDFSIPVIYTNLNQNYSINSTPNQQLNFTLRLDKQTIIVSANKSQILRENITLFNVGDNNITNITLANLSYIKINLTQDSIYPGSVLVINLELSSEKQGFFYENTTINFIENNTNYSIPFPIALYVLEPGTIIEQTKTCAELQGNICLSSQTCNGTSSFTREIGICCTGGSCISPVTAEEPSSYGWLWGVIIFIVLAAAGFFVYRKVKKSKPKDAEQAIAEKSKLYEKKISGGIERV